MESMKKYLDSNSPKTSSDIISSTILVAPGDFTQFQFKLRAIQLQRSAQIWLTWQLLSAIFPEVDICY